MNSKEIKKNVLNKINESRINAQAVADAKFKKAFMNSSFKEVYRKLKSLELEKAKLTFIKKPTNEIDKQINLKNNELEKILKALNLSMQDFQPNYECTKCNDTGILNNGYCNCFYTKYNEALIKNLGVNIDKTHTFKNANFRIFDKPEDTKKLYEKIFNWINNLNKSKIKTLVLMGDTGVGKTYLTESICNELISKNVVVNYYTSFALNDLFYKYHTSFSENRIGLLDGVLNCDVLIIDDFGSEPKIKTTEEYFYNLFNERLTKNLTTIITTNLNPIQIMEKYGERTFSRLNNKSCCGLLKLTNKDLRLKK